MLYSESQILEFHQHCVLIVSESGPFCKQINQYFKDSEYEALQISCIQAFPKLETMDLEKTYLCVLDLDHRPANTLQWLAKVKSLKINISLLVLGHGYYSNLLQHLILRAYSLVAWNYLDASTLSKEKFLTSLSSMLRDTDSAFLMNHNEHQVLSALNSIDESVIRINNDLKIEYMNLAAERLSGKPFESLCGKSLDVGFDFFDEHDKKSAQAMILKSMGSQEAFKLEGPFLLLGQDKKIHVSVGFAPIKMESSEIIGYFVIVRDVSLQHDLSNRLSYHSSHDQLTGLLSRMEFEARLQQAINHICDPIHEAPVNHVLIYLDIDQFKIINETCGHAVGDELIRQYSKELSLIVRKRDTLARLGGDEFAIILWDCSIDKGMEIADNIRTNTENFRFVWVDRIHSVSISVGVTPIESNALSSWAEALRLADGACQRAKENGRNRVELTDANDEQMQERYGEMEWINRLVSAFEGHGLLLFCQQIHAVNIGEDSCAKNHYEILVRYEDEKGKLVPPGVFLPPAERYNLIGMLDRWVVRSTFEWLSKHPTELNNLGLCSINLSGASLGDDNMPNYIKSCFEQTQIDPHKICFEITETVAVTNLMKANEFIKDLKEIGCKFSLDDFGVGMSSFAYLKHMDVDYVKIDGSFVRNIVSDPIDKEMVRSINDIGHILGKQTVAEFCEDQDCYDVLKQLSVDYVQGYFIGKPEPIDQIDFSTFSDLGSTASPLKPS